MNDTIQLAHGSGGDTSRRWLRDDVLQAYGNDILGRLSDAAVLPGTANNSMAFTTDSFVVSPLDFPGGDIGKLAVCGSVNDLAVEGARPKWLSCSLIIEEGFSRKHLRRILDSMAVTACEADVQIVCGDTKVVDHGNVDELYINTAGIGEMHGAYHAAPIREGDAVIISGTLGDHEAAVFQAREQVGLSHDLVSDCACLHDLTASMLAAVPEGIRVMRDPTRGGVGGVLNELAGQGCGVELDEDALPIRAPVQGLCELVGFDPLYLANEGKVVCVVAPGEAERLLDAMHRHPLGSEAVRIGTVLRDERQRVLVNTGTGGRRILPPPSGVQLPRIC